MIIMSVDFCFKGEEFEITKTGDDLEAVKKDLLDAMQEFSEHRSFYTLEDMLTNKRIAEPPRTIKLGGYSPIGFIYLKI